MDTADYRKLVEGFSPMPIHDRDQLERTEAVIDDLLALPERTPAQDAYLELLGMIVGDWEDANVVIPQLSGRELLEILMGERGLRQKDLLPIFGHESIVSEVLSGKRQFTVHHIEGLAEFFHVSPTAFMRRTAVAEPEPITV